MKLIRDGMTVGLGGGETVGYLIDMIAEKDLRIRVVTPSYTTAVKCTEAGLDLVPVASVQSVDIAFDGCDEADRNCCALKSAGGIHTIEKVVASLAKDYILLIDESKLYDRLPFLHTVTIEVLPEALQYVRNTLAAFGYETDCRRSREKEGLTVTDHGNYLLDAHIPAPEDCAQLEKTLKSITGIVDTSLFTGKVTAILCAGMNGTQMIERSRT